MVPPGSVSIAIRSVARRFHYAGLCLSFILFLVSCGRESVDGQRLNGPYANAQERSSLLVGKDDEGHDESAIHVLPGQSIQEALDRAADSADVNRVVVHAGTYAPPEPRQALIWFNARHDGITLEARGEVTLTAANADLADESSPSYPAVVNHVVYFGDGVSSQTVLRGFQIIGANNFVTQQPPHIEPATPQSRLKRTLFFYTDGGGIKVFGRSFPTIEQVEILGNYSSPCGAGISIEQRGFTDDAVTIRNCVFKNNRVPLTGAAIDLLDHELGSSAIVENCLFVENYSNCSKDALSERLGTWKPMEGHGAITVFPHSKLVVRRCTFVGNRNGIDDSGEASIYESCIFWRNNAAGGWATGERYEVDVKNTGGMTGCFFGGPVRDAAGKIDRNKNVLDAPDPAFDEAFVPKNPIYRDAGYRPVLQRAAQIRLDGQEQVTMSVPSDPESWFTGTAPLEVILRGRDFRWQIIYPGDDGKLSTSDDVRTEKNLHLPVNATVDVRVESDDYLYTVALPEFNVREIGVPELTHHLHLKTTRTGVSELVGDQFCGFSHPDLMGKVVVEEAAAFAAWYRRLAREESEQFPTP